MQDIQKTTAEKNDASEIYELLDLVQMAEQELQGFTGTASA